MSESQISPFVTRRERKEIQPILDAGANDYQEYGWNISGRPHLYMHRPVKLRERTVEILKTLDRTGGGEPSADHRVARQRDVHILIQDTIAQRYGVAQKNGRLLKLTGSVTLPVVFGPDRAPLGWVKDILYDEEDPTRAKIVIYRGAYPAGEARSIMPPGRRRALPLRSYRYFEGSVFTPKAHEPNLFYLPGKHRDQIFGPENGIIRLAYPRVCIAFVSQFMSEIAAGIDRRSSIQASHNASIMAQQRIQAVIREHQRVMPATFPADLVCMTDEAERMGIDVVTWSRNIVADMRSA